MTISLYRRDEPTVRGIAQVLVRHWPLLLILSVGVLVLGAVLAPALMALGLEGPGRVLYTVYSFQCHQLPQRSYFLFGPQFVQTYSWEQLLAAGMDPAQPRQFLGTAELGYKLGLAHRNTAIYFSLFAGSLLFALLRGRVRWRVSMRVYMLAWLFLALDGGSHLVSELTGWSFRVGNEWLLLLTGGTLPPAFYIGDGIGSFNWLMRTLTGTLVGFTTIWFVLPILQKGFEKRPAAREGEVTSGRVVASGEARHSAFTTPH